MPFAYAKLDDNNDSSVNYIVAKVSHHSWPDYCGGLIVNTFRVFLAKDMGGVEEGDWLGAALYAGRINVSDNVKNQLINSLRQQMLEIAVDLNRYSLFFTNGNEDAQINDGAYRSHTGGFLSLDDLAKSLGATIVTEVHNPNTSNTINVWCAELDPDDEEIQEVHNDMFRLGDEEEDWI